MSEDIKVLVVDDNAMLRFGLRESIKQEEGMTPVGEAANGIEAVAAYREVQPDVVTMDYRMPGEDGLAATRAILEEFPDAAIIFLSICEGEEDIWNAWRAGVRGYLSKSEAAENILEAIHEVGTGHSYFPATMMRKLEQRKQQQDLTPRELEVLKSLGEGKSNKDIMEIFDISLSTVKHHVANILDKLGAADRTHAVVLAYKKGVLHVDQLGGNGG